MASCLDALERSKRGVDEPMADHNNTPIAELGPATRGSGEPRQEGHPVVWDLSAGFAERVAIGVIGKGLPALVAALRWVFKLGQQVGQGSGGPAVGCPSCGRRASFADGDMARCVLCDHTWRHPPPKGSSP